ncbi:TonB-dependent receptor plug [Bacteroides heparinolyticus]|uniref:TonB-dependent receptor plug n=1 Tax=Prevotella heparinolytica TaxID=28113 RepID=A0A449I228_9BACE|nr:TonB-dependent receptor [Bacteroides heparinolyticus]VFB13448.1 TonB-dependent receptor plug [Bacteroides heparinolyticus]
MIKKILFLFFVLFAATAYSQDVTITGTVTDANKEPLTGVNVVVKGTTTGAITDIDGNFSVSGKRGSTLVFSYIGMISQEVVYKGTALHVVMQDDAKALEEVVVIGYQTVKKSDLTGAVAVVDTKEMKKSAAGTLVSQMQGLATGVNVRSSGRAGEDASIQIRGVGSLSNNSPLWVVDGMITDPGVDFNPADAESIQILKDASAAAIYGSRAANGVIIVTTKKGAKGPMKVNVSVKETLEWSPKYDLMNAAEYIKYNDIAYNEAIKDGIATVNSTQKHSSYDTNWQDEVLKTALVQDYNVSLSGGGDSGNYFLSAGYYKNNGVSYGNTFDRYSFRVNTQGKKGWFSFGENMAYSLTNTDPNQTNTYNDFLRMMPTIPIYDENNPGGYGYGDASKYNTFGVNPIAREDLEYRHYRQNRLNGSVWLEFKPFEFLSYKFNGGVDLYFYENSWFRGEGNWTQNQEHRDPEGQKARDNTYNMLIEHTLNFNKDFGKHHVDAVVGTTYQHHEWEGLWASRLNFPMLGNGGYLTVLNAGQSNQQNSNSISENAMISYLGRANYIYDDKYYLTATFRRDGTSRLAKENRWGNFPSFSGAWRISKEDFFDVSWINDLKIRGNWGRLGNASIGDWDYIGTINQSIVTVFGGAIVPGSTQVKLVNTGLIWETKETVNVGFDASFLNQRLTVSAEYYNSKTSDVLAETPIAISTGNQGGSPWKNAASLCNKGFEITLGWKDQVSDFKYNALLNVTTMSNEVLSLGRDGTERDFIDSGQARTEPGRSLAEFYLRKTDGIFKTQEEIDRYVTSKGTPIIIEGKRPKLGDVRYLDLNDDGEITDADRDYCGSPWPKMQMSLVFNAEWKNFDFSMMWNGQFGNKIYNVPRWQGRLFADNSNYIRFKKGEEPYQVNPDSDTPRIIYGDFRNSRDADRFLENGSYFRMKNISVGYNFKQKWLTNLGVEKLRLFATGSNLITITGYSGLDPDFKGANPVWNSGTDGFAYPNTRSVMFGLDLTF